MSIQMRFKSGNSAKKSSNLKAWIAIGVAAVLLILVVTLFLRSASSTPADLDIQTPDKVEQTDANNAATPPPPPPADAFTFDKNQSQPSTTPPANTQPATTPQNTEPPKDDAYNFVIVKPEPSTPSQQPDTPASTQPNTTQNGVNPYGVRQIEDLSSETKVEILPDNMIAYLKHKQARGGFVYAKGEDYFIVDEKTYKEGDFFKGWWKIEEINPLFLRFMDAKSGYAYNLRFID